MQSPLFVRSFFLIGAFVGSIGCCVTLTRGQEQENADYLQWLPETTLVYAEVKPLGEILDHPTIKHLQNAKEYKKLLRTPDLAKLRGGITLFELMIGDKADSIARKLTAGGVHVAIDAKTQGVVLLARTESQEWLEAYLQKLVELARKDAKQKQQPDPVRSAEYRGVKAYEFQKAIVANIGSTLIVTNKSDLGKQIVDRHLDQTTDSLQNQPTFQTAWTDLSNSPSLAKVYVDIEAARGAGLAKELLGKKQHDFAGELLLGGVLATLKTTPYAIGELTLTPEGTEWEMRVPHDHTAIDESRSFFFGADGQGHANYLVPSQGLLASLATYRNVSELWLRAGDLFDEKVNDQLAQADNTLTTLFSGKDFGTDILGAIEPQIQLVAMEQAFEPQATPAIQLPSFALVAKLKEPSMKQELKRIFQSFIGFLNVVGAMEGQPQLDLDSEQWQGLQLYTATYLRDPSKKYENKLPIQFNFSPTLAFHNDWVCVASSTSIAKQLVQPATSTTDNVQPSPGPHNIAQTDEASQDNTILEVDFEALKRVLESNQAQLVSQQMLEKGMNRDEAEAEIGKLMNVLGLVQSGRGVLRFDDFARLRFVLELVGE